MIEKHINDWLVFNTAKLFSVKTMDFDNCFIIRGKQILVENLIYKYILKKEKDINKSLTSSRIVEDYISSKYSTKRQRSKYIIEQISIFSNSKYETEDNISEVINLISTNNKGSNLSNVINILTNKLREVRLNIILA